MLARSAILNNRSYTAIQMSVAQMAMTAIWLVAVSLLLSAAPRPASGQPEYQLPQLAPGVLTVVPAEPDEEDTVTGPLELPELAAIAEPWQPHFQPESDTLDEMSKQLVMRRSVWQLEIATKPLRMLTVDTGGRKTRVWYLVYRLRNTGGHLRPEAQDGGRSFALKQYDRDVRFFPHFTLVDHEQNKRYLDRVMPAAVAQIQRKELRDPKIRLHDSVTISRIPIKPSSDAVDRSVWGVATWTDVDRRADFVSVYIQGLTNAYRFVDKQDQDRQYYYKTLQLNYWRPGDAVYETSAEFRVGLPTFQEGAAMTDALKLYGMRERSDYAWVFRR